MKSLDEETGVTVEQTIASSQQAKEKSILTAAGESMFKESVQIRRSL